MRSLSWKLGGALLLVVVISVGLMAYLVNLSTTREFRQYVVQGNMMYTQSIADNLSRYYVQERGWVEAQKTLNSFPVPGNIRLVLVDSFGKIVGDTGRDWLNRDAKSVGLNGGTPVVVSGQEVGELYVLSSGGMMMGGGGMMGGMMGGFGQPAPEVAEQEFLGRINSSLWLTGLIAAAAALLLGIFLTRHITSPIRALSKGASHIAKGDLGYRVNVNTRDEIGDLAQSFNAMSASLDKGEQSRRRLVADIAHELRTPLTVIDGTVSGIMDGVFKPDAEHLGAIKEQTALLTRLIGDLRDLSLAESGQMKLELAPTDMVDLVRRKLSQAEVAAREKSIELKLNALPNVPEVNVDSIRMEQVISNLLANAVRHTPDGGSITASLAAVSCDSARHVKPSLVISIADTGEGIPPEHLPHVFERFYRVQDSRSRSDGGAGLGLAIVKQMVEAHGGRAWAESEVGKGSTFYIQIPMGEKVA
ncbi:MAG: HAMP domain-containing protein [Chloroflexi bacterium]|nr:HAMP domain-containing protein [Chloroflexota bacterium]